LWFFCVQGGFALNGPDANGGDVTSNAALELGCRFEFLHADNVDPLLRQPWQQILAAGRTNSIEINADYSH